MNGYAPFRWVYRRFQGIRKMNIFFIHSKYLEYQVRLTPKCEPNPVIRCPSVGRLKLARASSFNHLQIYDNRFGGRIQSNLLYNMGAKSGVLGAIWGEMGHQILPLKAICPINLECEI